MTDRREALASWAEVLDDSSYYELLGILELADTGEIQRAFHDFALAFHPDVHRSGTEEERALSARIFRRGTEAYRVLSDPELRRKYDLALAEGKLRLVATFDAAPRRASALKSLAAVCRTPAARFAAERADERIGQGNLAEARRLLQEALVFDQYANPDLEERIEALDLALFAQGS